MLQEMDDRYVGGRLEIQIKLGKDKVQKNIE